MCHSRVAEEIEDEDIVKLETFCLKHGVDKANLGSDFVAQSLFTLLVADNDALFGAEFDPVVIAAEEELVVPCVAVEENGFSTFNHTTLLRQVVDRVRPKVLDEANY